MGATSRRNPPAATPCPLCAKRALGPGCYVRIDRDLSPACRACWEHAYYSPCSFRRRLDPAPASGRFRDALVL